jgi:hypothetical protein
MLAQRWYYMSPSPKRHMLKFLKKKEFGLKGHIRFFYIFHIVVSSFRDMEDNMGDLRYVKFFSRPFFG